MTNQSFHLNWTTSSVVVDPPPHQNPQVPPRSQAFGEKQQRGWEHSTFFFFEHIKFSGKKTTTFISGSDTRSRVSRRWRKRKRSSLCLVYGWIGINLKIETRTDALLGTKRFDSWQEVQVGVCCSNEVVYYGFLCSRSNRGKRSEGRTET